MINLEDKELTEEKLNNESGLVNSNSESKKIVKNIIIVTISNFIKLFAGILVGFVIPKIMGETNYGYYKTFSLYLGYVGLFHFGFIDGIYLIFAGKKYDDLNKKSFRFYSRFLVCMETIISLILIAVSLCFINSYIGFILLFISISLFATNLTSYYQFISQITGRFKELSFRNLIQSILQALAVIVCGSLWYFGVISELYYKIFVIIWTSILVLLSLWYVITYKDITFGKSNTFRLELPNIKKFFIVGFPLMIANLVASLILTIDKQFVSILTNNGLYTIGEFGIYSFAYTMLNIITTVISAISVVLYPTIKNYSYEKLKNNYNYLISIICIVTSICLLAYQPLCFIVTKWLPKYVDSLIIFRVILPGLILSSCVTMIMFNYYKALGKHFLFFIISVVILGVSILANVIAYFTTKELIWISIASVIIIGVWYIISDVIVTRTLKIKNIKNYLFIIIVISSFYLVTCFISNIFLSFFIYFLIILFSVLIFYLNVLKKIIIH